MEAIVIGGGPAGLSASIGLARSGFSVRLFEMRKEWTGRVCGSYLSPESTPYLNWLGLGDKISHEPRVHSGQISLSGSGGHTWSISLEHDGQAGWAIPRKKLENLLFGEAEKCGVTITLGTRTTIHGRKNKFWEIRTQSIDDSKSKIIHSPLVVCAEGRFRSLSFRQRVIRNRPPDRWLAWNAEFRNVSCSTGDLSLHFLPGTYIGTLTYKDETTNVCGLIRRDLYKEWGGNWESVLENFKLHDKCFERMMGKAEQISPFKSVGALPFGWREPIGPGVFLAGDSAAVCDPFMGEGISRALSAGPTIFKVFQDREKSVPEILSAQKEYEDLWKRSYGWRYKMGVPLKWFQGSSLGLSVLGSLILKKRYFLKSFLSKIHSSSQF